MTLIDSHMHVWRAAEAPTPGVTTLVPPQTDVPIETARAAMAAAGVERAVLVQPIFRADDNSYVAGCARAEPERFAAVCVVDPRTADTADKLEYWIDRGCRGVRLRSGQNCNMGSLDDPTLEPLWEAAEQLGTVVSLLIGPESYSQVVSLAARHSQISFVLDHLGRWGMTSGHSPPNLMTLTRRTTDNLYVKLSGFHHLSHSTFPYREWWSTLRWCVDAFGPRRLMVGSDFPHCNVTCGYANSLHVVDEALSQLAAEDRAMIRGGTAQSLYWPPARCSAD